MNKILVVEDNKNIEDGEYLIDILSDTNININGNVTLHNYSDTSNKLVININNDSSLKIDKVEVLKKDLEININIKNNSNLEYNMLIINEGINKLILNVNLLDNDILAKVNLRAINKNNNSNIDIVCNGFVLDNTYNNELIEDLKGLMLGNDTIKISPNMIVNTNEVVANHLVTIGSFNKEEIFYLKSKGLSEEVAKNLLIESFTTSIISDYFKDKIKMEVINYE